MKARNEITVAIDGPAGAGKSTVAKGVAAALGYTLVDTGAIYRAVALLAARSGIATDDDRRLSPLVEDLRIHFVLEGEHNRVWVDGADVSAQIRTPEVSMAASTVSTRKVVRDGLLALQRRLAGEGGAVLEGRDIGSVVCPDAEVKIYLDADAGERARRRHAELVNEGGPVPSLQEVLADVERRDAQDMQREHAPLTKAADASVIDSTTIPVAEVIDRIVEIARRAEGR